MSLTIKPGNRGILSLNSMKGANMETQANSNRLSKPYQLCLMGLPESKNERELEEMVFQVGRIFAKQAIAYYNNKGNNKALSEISPKLAAQRTAIRVISKL